MYWTHGRSLPQPVSKHDHACSKCLLLQVFKNALIVGRLWSEPSLVGRVELGVRVSDSFHILSCAVVRAVRF